MSTVAQLIASFIAGTLFGLAFFRGLWLTISTLDQARHPALWVLSSLLLRFGLVLGAFYLLARHAGWPHLLAAATGFTVARLVLVQRLSPQRAHKEPGT
jgi:F1F0 ATPase subunit 2